MKGKKIQQFRSSVESQPWPFVPEGWIDDRSGLDWRITPAGRRAADKPAKPPAGRKG